MDKRRKGNWINLLFYGSLWGISEVLVENFIVPICPIPRSIILTTIAIGILTMAKITLQQSWNIFVIGVIAALYKFLNVRFFGCQILALLMLTGSFEIIHAWLKNRLISRGIIGVITVFIFNTTFALVATFILKNPWWVSGGITKMLNFILIEGSITAVLVYGICILVNITHKKIHESYRYQQLQTVKFFDYTHIIFAVSAAIIVVIWRIS